MPSQLSSLRSVRAALFALGPWLLAGCMASAQFHAKSGRDWQPLTRRAVLCNENEARAVTAAGGFPIGTITAKGLATDATPEDVADKAAVVAAKQGGTHIVRTEHGVEWFTTVHPAVTDRQCRHERHGVDCRETTTPSTTTTYSQPTAKFVVLRLPEQRWSGLPPELVPGRR